ncbi:MAG: LysM peptidoglycan-binding domain-containing protein [Clostridia bacterium]|nr:LysM peptidoglycan-binding domain-containing protein [Clostridia bacterium]
MEFEWIRENMETEQIIAAKPTQVSVETEVALPGGLREEAKVYFADATAAVNGGELSGSRVTADGRVTFHVLYGQGDLANVRALEATADFSQALPLKEDYGQLAAVRLQPRAEVQHVSAKAFNGRLLLQAILNLTAEASLPRTVSFIRDVAETPDIQKISQTVAMQRTVGEGEAQNLFREEFELSDVLKITDTLFASAEAQVEDIMGGADGKAAVTGTVTIDAYHTSGLPGRPLVYTRHTMPYEQQVTLSGALGTALAAQTAVKDVAVLSQETEDGGRLMRAEIQLVTAIRAVEDQEMDTLRDAFTTSGDALELQTRQVVFRSGTVNETAAESGRTLMVLPEGSPRVKTPLLAFVRPVLAGTELLKDNRLAADGVLDITLIYQTDDSDVPVSVRQEEMFHTVFSTQALPDDSLTLTAAQVEPSAVTGDRVELKYILRLHADGVRKGEAALVADAASVPAAEVGKGIILYYLQPGETVWDLAKRCRVPLGDITRLNPALPDSPDAGTPVIAYKR